MRSCPAPWTFDAYREILSAYRDTICDFTDVAGRDSFCLVPHDIEFSLARAVALGEVDAQSGVSASFFVQVANSAYNPLAPDQRALVRSLKDQGHHVGLHLYASHIAEGDRATLEQELAMQVEVLETVLGRKIDRFSYHRPKRWMLELGQDAYGDILSAYAPAFFELTDGGAPGEIKYMADSQHRWAYGHPLDAHGYDKVQLLLHPDEWSAAGGATYENFEALIDEARDQFIGTIRNECNHYERACAERDEALRANAVR